MARSVQDIQSEMDALQAQQPVLAQLNSPSQSAVFTLWKYITALATFVSDTTWDLFKQDLETVVANAPVGTNQWVRQQVLNFQYDAATPQILRMIDFVPTYNPVDATKRIITRCSSTTVSSRIVTIKVAKQEPPVALASPELSSLTGYLTSIGFAGVEYAITSNPADKLFLEAEVFFDGQYSAVITTSVIDAVRAYLAGLDFDGKVYVSKLEDAIQAVAGVNDVVIKNLSIRADVVAFPGGTSLVLNQTLVVRSTGLYAGYVVEETTAGDMFLDKLTFTAQ